MIARIALALGALTVSVFLALELHSEHRLQHGKAAADLSAQRGLSPAQRVRVLDDLRAGQRLHPGTDALLARALVELRAGHDAEAERLAHRSIEREPRNWGAWRALAASLQGHDSAGAQRAARHARRLNPLAP